MFSIGLISTVQMLSNYQQTSEKYPFLWHTVDELQHPLWYITVTHDKQQNRSSLWNSTLNNTVNIFQADGSQPCTIK